MVVGGPEANENDPARWGHSLANLGEILVGCLDASGAKSVAEVGAWAGDLTRLLLDWAVGSGGRVIAIDPTPHPRLLDLSEERPDLELIRESSHDALGHIALPDAVIIDGDHNYHTVSEELRIIGERAPGAEIPLLMFHDVGWPHGRRDAYWNPERIPEEHRQPLTRRPLLFPGEPGLVDAGLLMYTSATREGGPRNGVLTALEDSLERRPDLRLATVPAFFGFGVVWHRDAPWADAVAKAVEPWDRNPLIERLEANRVYHLAMSQSRSVKLEQARAALEEQRQKNAKLEQLRANLEADLETLRKREAELERLRAKSRSQERVIRALLDSGGLRLADRVSALRHPRRDWSWPGRLRGVLGEDDGGPRPTPAVGRAKASSGVLTWESDERCVVGDATFQILPADIFESEQSRISMEGAGFLLGKTRPLVDRYVELLGELRPRHIFELGILEGGSTAFLFELARPRRLVAVDQKPPTTPALRNYIARERLDQAVYIHDDVDQADRQRLAEIVEEAFGDEPLDLVVDDCSHFYEPTRASFNELFPRLRPGGVYVIEDWQWAHESPLDEMWTDEIPLTRLIFELLLAIPALPGLIADVTVEGAMVQVWRGDAEMDPGEFEIPDRTRSLLGQSDA